MFNHLDLFSGIGGFALAASWAWGADHHIVSFCEIDPFCRKVLNKHWPDAPISTDIKTLSWENKECEPRHKDKQTPETSTLPKKQNSAEELLSNANNVGLKNLYRQASLFGGTGGNIVRGIAEERQCEAKKEPTLAVVPGCEGQETQIIKMEQDTTGPEENTKIKSHNGADGFLQETITPAKFVKSNPKNQANSMPTTSKAGRNTQNSDSPSQTGEHYAKSATKQFMRGKIDLLTAGVPCQPASCAGKRKGTSDDRWLWGETYRIIREAKPTWVILENVRGLLSLESGVVFENLLLELEALGYEVSTFIIPACAVNAPHRRDRIWIVAHRPECRRGQGDTNAGGSQKGMGPEWNGKRLADAFVDAFHPTNRKNNMRINRGMAETEGCRERVNPAACACDQLIKNTIGGGVRGRSDGDQAGSERTLQIKRSDCDATHSGNERLQGGQRPGTRDERPAPHGSVAECHSAWDEPWIEAATRLCGIFNGLSAIMDRIGGINANTSQKLTGQDLPCLWGCFQSETFQWNFGRFDTIQNKENVFAVLWKHFSRTYRQDNLPFESAAVQNAFMRNMWVSEQFGRPPQRWEYQEQYAKEHSDRLSQLSHEIALEASQVTEQLSKDRVHRLKALGNAIVPQVAYEIMKAIREAQQ